MHPTSAAALWQQAREAQENAKALEEQSKTLAAQATALFEKEAAEAEKAAVAARKKVEEAKAQEAAYFNATAKAWWLPLRSSRRDEVKMR